MGKALASDLAPKHPRALGVGLYSSVVGAARLVASLVGGQLWQTTGPTATFVYAAGLAASGAIVLAARVPNRSAPSSGRHLV